MRRRASTFDLLDVIVASGIERNISLKLTQLGAGVDRATCVDNLRRILEAAPAARILRPHRHGELAVDAADARCLRDAVAAGVPEHRDRAAGGALPQRAGRRAHE